VNNPTPTPTPAPVTAETQLEEIKEFMKMKGVTIGGNWIPEIIIEYIECLIVARDYFKDEAMKARIK